ncbi:MAG: FAD-dependent oxidoreductase [Planctomycetes bacterium]|nr:FAD-dependent oxidoreductase [Planctomycetota bacterium]
MRGRRCEVMVVGGGLGGCAAALAAAEAGRRVVLTEETDWIGGQVTSQGVSALDEHRWIEFFGATASYQKFREEIRSCYREHYPLTPHARAERFLNPGGGYVSRLCHEPRVALAVLESLLAPHRAAGRVEVLLRTRPTGADVAGDRVRCVRLADLDDGGEWLIEAPMVLDATELGDLLPLTGTEYVSGAEGRDETGEPHAAAKANPDNVQSFTACFALDYCPGESHVIDEPRGYVAFRDAQISWCHTHPITLQKVTRTLFHLPNSPWGTSLWLYRRILDRARFADGAFPSDLSLINWPQNDYWDGNIIDQPEAEAARHVDAAKRLSLSLLYWLQTEAPREDGGAGYPGLRLRPDVMGSRDGLAKMPYIRESRRIRAVFTVLEQHLSPEIRKDQYAEPFPDSVGLGLYRIDLHPSSGGDNYIDLACAPFRIPLGALIPVRMENLIPANKNIGTTHVTNGAYRLHPVEWNIGEAAGALAVFCLERACSPRKVREDKALLDLFQRLLERRGVPLSWPEAVPV